MNLCEMCRQPTKRSLVCGPCVVKESRAANDEKRAPLDLMALAMAKRTVRLSAKRNSGARLI